METKRLEELENGDPGVGSLNQWLHAPSLLEVREMARELQARRKAGALEALRGVRDDDGLADLIQGIGEGDPPFMTKVKEAIAALEAIEAQPGKEPKG